MLLFSFCDCHWVIPWLLAALLGLLLGWLLFAGVRKRLLEIEEENGRLKKRIADLEGELSDCKAKRAALDSELTLLKGTIREQQSALSDASAQKTRVGKEQQSAVSDTSAEKAGIKERQSAVSDASAEKAGIKEQQSAVSDTSAQKTSVGKEQQSPVSDASAEKTGVKKEPPATSDSAVGLGAFAAGAASSGKSKNIYAVLSADNLQVVEGIGPKMDEVLKSEGVKSWSALSASSPSDLRALLDKVNQKRYRIIDPSTWPKQAKMADSGDWEALIAYQKNLGTGKDNTQGGQTDSKVEKMLIKMGAMKRWKQDDLKAVEGIGPKIEGLLKAAGIDTWRKLSTAKSDRLKSILEEAGPRFRLADPTTWPKQAEMAAEGRWDDLDEYQDFLQGGK